MSLRRSSLNKMLQECVPCLLTHEDFEMGGLVTVQVFVANPNKTEKITELLQHNKDKLLRYLGDFHTDKGALTTSTGPLYTHLTLSQTKLAMPAELCTP